MTPQTRRKFLCSLAAFPLATAHAKSWDQPAFPNWPPEFVDSLLTDSPWARPLSVVYTLDPEEKRLRSDLLQIGVPGIGFPRIPGVGWPGGPTSRQPRTGPGSPTSGPGNGPRDLRTQMHLTIRWSSALPIRRALALEEFGRQGLDSPKAAEMLSRQESEYVIEISGIPSSLDRAGAPQIEKDLMRTASLIVKGRRSGAPTSVTVPQHGSHLIATIRLPRFEKVDENDGPILFSARAGKGKIELPFKLKSMVYQNRLEL